jgi:hypothetical protein
MVMRLVSSTTVITLTSEESLSSATKSLVSAGNAMRTDWGKSTCHSTCKRDKPSEPAASA